jgi:hypothetical protein
LDRKDKLFFGGFLLLGLTAWLGNKFPFFIKIFMLVALIWISLLIINYTKEKSIHLKRAGILGIIALVMGIIFKNTAFTNTYMPYLLIAIGLILGWELTLRAKQNFGASLIWLIVAPIFIFILATSFFQFIEIDLSRFDYFLIPATFLASWIWMSWFAEIKIIQSSIFTIGLVFTVLSLVLHTFVDVTLSFDLVNQFVKDPELLEVFNNTEGENLLNLLAKVLTFPTIISCLICLGVIQYRKMNQNNAEA